MSRPKEYEFPHQTVIDALRRADWKCEQCGKPKKDTPEGYLELHHLLPVMIAVKYYPHILPELIASLDNCKVLCCQCHSKADEESRLNHPRLALEIYTNWLEAQLRLERAAKQLEAKRESQHVQRRLF